MYYTKFDVRMTVPCMRALVSVGLQQGVTLHGHCTATALLPVGPPRDAGQPGWHPWVCWVPEMKSGHHTEGDDMGEKCIYRKNILLLWVIPLFSSGKICFSFTITGYKDNKYRFLPLLSSHFHITKKHENCFLTHPFSCVKIHLFILMYLFFFFLLMREKNKQKLCTTFTFMTFDFLNRL